MILKINKPEWMLIVIGCIAAFLNGALEPTSAIIQTKLVTVEDSFNLKNILFKKKHMFN
jgi:hypothetical protein